MNLFQRLLFRRLCEEQPADGGAAPAASEPAQQVTEPGTEPAGDAPAEGAESAPIEGKKPEGEKDNDKPADADKDKKSEGAPEKYEFTAPDGAELDTAALEQFEPVARELNLTNEQAQKLVGIYPKLLESVQQRQVEAWQTQTEEWAATVKADKEIGGDKLTSNLSVAQRALDTFGTPELKEYLNSTGLGNHPDLVRFCVNVGKTMSEDSMVSPGTTGQLSAAEVLYGNK